MGIVHFSGAKRAVAVLTLLTLACANGVPMASALAVTRTLTLTGPAVAEMGEPVAYSGRLAINAVGVPNETVLIEVGGVGAASTVTKLDGTYSVPVTFAHFGMAAVRAVAYKGTPLELSSVVLNVDVPRPGSEDPTAPSAPVPSFFAATRFLYTGPGAVQTGVEVEALDPAAVAVVRGSVAAPDGTPLSDVEVRVVGREEFGRTSTGVAGALDMVVNGGQPLVVEFEKTGYIPVQREVVPPWRDYAVLPAVVMTPYDPIATPITLSAPNMQVARGTVATDADGARQSTLLFPPSVDAVMTLEDGTVQALDSMSVRATELTVGDSGPAAMPGQLPSESGFTYAVEFSVDEAVAAGASSVDFTEPVINYVENFLAFPVGTPVPTGYYDREAAAWSASPDGIVLEILSIIDGKAEIDTDGDGVAQDAAGLASFGITEAERAQLGALYGAGQSLWRVPIPHFTPWDHNWPYGLPGDAEAPGQTPASSQQSSTQCSRAGSVIGCENQTLGEALPLAGTPFALRYDSALAPGRVADRALSIDLTDATPPASLKSVTVEIAVAGRLFLQSYPSAADLQHPFVWDGLDAYGRPMEGAQPAKVRINYLYDAVYYQPATGFRASFGLVGSAPISRSRTRREITVSQEYETVVGGLSGKGLEALGGWSLSALHAYDVEGRTLHLGTGERRAVDAMPLSIARFAGNGQEGSASEGTYSGDGGRAGDAGLSYVRGIAVGGDGSIYIADTGNGVVRRVTRAGTISTVAGGGSPTSGNGDGGPATSARLVTPTDVAVGPDGSLYISDPGSARVRRVDPAGAIHTFAGGGSPPDGLGDGGPAQSAQLGSPRGLTFGPGGALYVADAQQKRIRRVTPDGSITTVAGGGAPPDGVGDGLPATQAALALPLGVAVDKDGTLYVADANQHRVRVIRRDGLIGTFAGTGVYGYTGDNGPAGLARVGYPVGVAMDPTDGSVLFTQRFHNRVRKVSPQGVIGTAAGTGAFGASGDSGPPQRAVLQEPHDVAVDPDGTLFIADTNRFQVRRVAPPLPGFGQTDFMVPSEEGTEIYLFDQDGRHLRTLDALTNAVIYRFMRDEDGQLSGIEDSFGNVTTVERDAAGLPTAIRSPFGLRTEVTVNPQGHLSTVTNPASETVTLGYGAGGLLTSLVTPRGATYTFVYDAFGRLLEDHDLDGSSTTLSRVETVDGFQVISTSAEGRVTTYGIEELADGSRRRTVTHPSGATEVVTARLDGSSTTVTSDGVSASVALAPDPRWGMLAPLPASATTTLPSGVSVTTTSTRTVSLGDPSDLLSLQSQTDTSSTNGNTTTTVYDANTRRVTTTTPGGRIEKETLDSRGLVIRTEQGDLAPTEFGYDTRGRPTTVTTGTGTEARTTSYEYGTDGMVSALTDARDDRVAFERDPVGRVIASTWPGNHRSTYGYDTAGNLISLRPPGKPAHAFDYTPGDLVSAYRPPDGSPPLATTFTYNLDLQPQQTSTPDGRTVVHGYDAAGRPQTSSFSRGQVTTAYDSSSRLAQLSAPGGETVQFGYDGNLLTRVTAAGTVAGQVDYGYGGDLQRNSRSVNDETAKVFAYDDDGFPTAAGALTLTWHAANGNLTGTALGGVTTAHGYNIFGESTSMTASHGVTGLYSVSYVRDDLGRISQKTETVAGVTRVYDYVYDSRGQLEEASVDGVVARSYTHDDNGNRTAVTDALGSVSATYDDQDRMLSRGAASYTYTAAGDLATKTEGAGTTTYSYDELGNLITVTLPSERAITYTVDGMNRRVAKSVDGVVVRRWLYGDGPAPVAELDAAGSVAAEYVYAARPNVPDYIVQGGVTYRVLSDQVGSPRLVVDVATGTVAQRLDYDEFGNVLADSNPGFQPFGFAGGLYDVDTALVRFGARDYDPVAGRWTARDPIGFEGGINLYEYGGNDPVNNMDPTGLDWVQGVGDFSAGFGDTITLGGTRVVRRWMGVDSAVNYCSGFYTGGEYASFGAELALGAKGATSVVRWGRGAGRVRGGAAAGDELAEMSGMLRDARRGKGNFGIGQATSSRADELGRAWVGEGHSVASDGRTLVSGDGLRQYRPPARKRSGAMQANLEGRFRSEGRWQSNAHIDIMGR